MTRTQEAIKLQIGRIEDRFDCRNDRDVIAEERKILDVFPLCPKHGQCSTGHRCFEAQRKEHNLPAGVFASNLQGIQG